MNTLNETLGDYFQVVTCSAECNPSCHYSWSKDTSEFVVSHTKRLYLGVVDREDTGQYTCLAHNIINNTIRESFATLMVYVKCKYKQPIAEFVHF